MFDLTVERSRTFYAMAQKAEKSKNSPQGVAAGTTVVIKLKYVGKQHKPNKYVVYTTYLEADRDARDRVVLGGRTV